MIVSTSIIEVAEDQGGQIVGFVALPDADPEKGSQDRQFARFPSSVVRASERDCCGKPQPFCKAQLPEEKCTSGFLWRTSERSVSTSGLAAKLLPGISRIPAAGKKPIACIHWPDFARLS